MTDKRPQGPNVKRFIVHRMSQCAIPKHGGFADAIKFLTNNEAIARGAREATDWCFAAIDAVKIAPDCPWSTDEEIAGEILRQIEERKRQQRFGTRTDHDPSN